MATHSSIPAWRIPGTEEPGRLQSLGSQESDTTERLRDASMHTLKSSLDSLWASLVAQSVKNTPVVQETWVRSLGWKDPLEKEMATHSSVLAWKISWTQEPGGLQSMRVSKNQARLSD